MFPVVRLEKPDTCNCTVEIALNQRDHENQTLLGEPPLPKECLNWPSQVTLIFHTSVAK